MKQKMMGWQWHQLDHMQIICTSLQTDNMPAPYHSFLQPGFDSLSWCWLTKVVLEKRLLNARLSVKSEKWKQSDRRRILTAHTALAHTIITDLFNVFSIFIGPHVHTKEILQLQASADAQQIRISTWNVSTWNV